MTKSKTNRISIFVFLIIFVCAFYVISQAQVQTPASLILIIDEANQRVQAQKWSEAEQLFKKAVTINPYRGEVWFNLGRSQMRQKDYQNAIASFQKALDLRAGVPYYTAYYIASCYSRLKQKVEAIAWLEKSFALGFGSLNELHEDTDFEFLHNDSRYQRLAGTLPSKALSQTEGRIFDLKLLVREINRVHYSPYRFVSQSKFNALVQQLEKDIPKLTDNQFLVRVLQLVVLLGDGHTHAFMDFRTPDKFLQLPIKFYTFEEGIYVIAAPAEYENLIGSRVVSLNKHRVEDVIKQLETVIASDNKYGIMETGAEWMSFPQPLNGLGLIPSDKEASFQFQDPQGQIKTVVIPSVTKQPPPDKWIQLYQKSGIPIPLYLKDRQAKFWFEHLPEKKMVFCQINQIFHERNETFPAFVKRLFNFINDNSVERLIIDMRWNPGGNGYLAKPLLTAIIRNDNINQRGNLFIIVGRKTFSAAMITAGQIERNTNAIFVGERTGTNPNFVGEDNHFTLPYTKFDVSLSNVYHQNSYGNDYRMWIAPEIHTPPTFEFYRTNRDPALEAIFEAISAKKN